MTTEDSYNRCIRSILDEYYEGESSRDAENNNEFDKSSTCCQSLDDKDIEASLCKESSQHNRQDLHTVSPTSSGDHTNQLLTQRSSDIDELFQEIKNLSSNISTNNSNEDIEHEESDSEYHGDVSNNKAKANHSLETTDHPSVLQPVTNTITKEKKPFLKKGSRKEPSSLQRVSSDIVKNGMRFKNDIKVNNSDGKSCETNNNLERLERMQEEQIENLEKRIERRERARLDIKRNKSDTKVLVAPRQVDIKTDVRNQSCDVNECTSDSESSDDESSTCSKDSENSESSIERNEYIVKETSQHSSRMTKQNTTLDSSTKESKKRGRRRDRLKENNESRSPELEEQWQIIKSMRKRQEAALRSAEKEREKTRQWCNNEKKSVQKWSDQQRMLLKKERKRVMNDHLASQRKHRLDSLEESAAAVSLNNQKQLRSEIESLKSTLQKLQIESDTTKSKFRLTEKRLRDIISERAGTISSLKVEITELNEKYIEIKQEKDELSKFKRSYESKKKKKIRMKKDDKPQQAPLDENESKQADQSVTKEDMSVSDITDKYNNVEVKDREETNIARSDKEALRVINSRKDLIETPTETWLQKHLQLHNQKDDDQAVLTPSKNRVYDPANYTPKNNVPKGGKSNIDQRLITYHNGTQKEILNDGTIIVRFTNGDTKTTYSHIGIVVYYYAESKTSHTSHPDGLEIFEFASGQTERHYPNGRKEVLFPDGTQHVFLPNGDTVDSFTDGVHVMESCNGTKKIHQSFH